MNQMGRRKWILTAIALVVLVVVAVLLLGGCASKYTEPYKDAPRGETNNSKADLVTFPDGFTNVATKCDHHNRIYVGYHGDHAYGTITVVPNAKGC